MAPGRRGASGRTGRGSRLVAYVVGRDRSTARPASRRACRTTWCRRRSSLLDALPPHVDGQARRGRAARAGRSEVVGGRSRPQRREELLCELFAEVLGLPAVGVDEDFFALGGDSIVSIQLVGRARAAGLGDQPPGRVRAPDPGRARPGRRATVDSHRPGRGPRRGVRDAPLTPVMRWLARASTARSTGYSQSMLLHAPAGLDRGRAGRGGAGAWSTGTTLLRARAGPPTACGDPGPAAPVDVVRVAPDAGENLPAIAAGRPRPARPRAVASCSRRSGSTPGHGLLLLSCTTCVVDGVSWRILLPDLRRRLARPCGRAAGHPRRRPAPRSGAGRTGLDGRAARRADRRGVAVLAERAGRAARRAGQPAAGPGPATAPAAATRHPRTCCRRTHPAAAHRRCRPAFHAGVDDVLLTGLALARAPTGRGGAARWCWSCWRGTAARSSW